MINVLYLLVYHLGKDNTRESLNEVSHNAAIALIRHALSRGVRVAEVYVDTVGPPEKYQDKLQKIFPDIKVPYPSVFSNTFRENNSARLD